MITGKVQMTREGYAFVIVEGEEDDVFVKASKTRGALNGDIVRVSVKREKTDRQRREGEVIEIVESRWHRTPISSIRTPNRSASVPMGSMPQFT